MIDEPTLRKIAKLIPALHSHSEIEIASAARAIERLLKAIGADWHDLAAVVSGENTDARVQTLQRRCRDVLERVELQAYEAKFLHQVIENYELNPDWAPSEKQGRWLASLLGRATNGGSQ